MLDGLLGVFGEDVGVVAGHFLRGGGVVAGADLVEDAVDVFPGVFFGAFEHHVLEEVGDAVDIHGFVAGAGFDEHAGGDGVRIGVDLGDDVEAVFKLMMFERKWHVYWLLMVLEGEWSTLKSELRSMEGGEAGVPFNARMHGGVPPCDPRKSVEMAPPAAAYWRSVFKCNCREEKGGKGLQVCAGWREAGLAGPPVPGQHNPA